MPGVVIRRNTAGDNFEEIGCNRLVCTAVQHLPKHDVLLISAEIKNLRLSIIKIKSLIFQFFFFVMAPSFFIFSFICNLIVLSSIVQRQSKTARKQIGRTMNPRQLQQQKGIVYTYIFQAFLPLVLATPYYIASESTPI